jgi:hypothetical protein
MALWQCHNDSVANAPTSRGNAVIPQNEDLSLEWLERLQRGVALAFEEHRRHGRCVVVMRDDNVVWLTPEEY